MDPSLLGETVAADLAVLVAPGAGAFRPLPDGTARPGCQALLAGGGVLGHVVSGGHRREVLSPSDAVLHRVLAGRNQPVGAGQVLAWGRRCHPGALEAR